MAESEVINPKLTRRLKRALLVTLLIVLVLATVAAAITSYFDASDIQDETLLSVAQLVESNQMGTPTDNNLFDDDHVDDSAVRVWQLGRESRHGITVKKKLSSGFHTLHEDDDFWRVYVTRKNRSEKQFIVAQKLSVSAEIAFNSAKTTALPLLLLFLLVPLLVSLIVRHSFKPLNDLTSKLDNSDSLQLDIENKKKIPVELMPFITAIDSLLEKNEAHNQRQRRFIADAAHELRTPITALSLEIENVQSAKNEESKKARQSALATSVNRLQRLVNQLLDLARAQSGLTNKQSTVSLNDIVKNQVAELYLLAEKKLIDIEVSRNETVLVIDSNSQIQHLVRNALSNAIKFTPAEGAINIAVYIDEADAVFTVEDNGPGVSDEQLINLHEPFYRPDGQASGQGAGLGLAICHEIATQLNGTLTLENIDPNGFRFSYRQTASLETQ